MSSANPGNIEWFYEHSGVRIGPKSSAEICDLLNRGEISLDTLAWHSAFGQLWKPIRETGIVQSDSPPPIPVSRVNNVYAWILSSIVIVFFFVDTIIDGASKDVMAMVMGVYFIIYVTLIMADIRNVSRSGRELKWYVMAIGFLFYPFYLFNRARLLGQSQSILLFTLFAATAVALISESDIFLDENAPKGIQRTESGGGVSAQLPQDHKSEIFKITSNDLYNMYEKNELSADEKLSGKILEIRGIVASIDKSNNDDAIIRLETQNKFAYSNLVMRPSEKPHASLLNKGDSVTIRCGQMQRYIGYPLGGDCIFFQDGERQSGVNGGESKRYAPIPGASTSLGHRSKPQNKFWGADRSNRVFSQSGGSMMPSINVKDNILGANSDDHLMAYGDIIIFKKPPENKIDYIKRIVGLPEDRIQVKGGVLHVNGVSVDRQPIEDYVARDRDGNIFSAPQYIETLPNGQKHRIIETHGDDGPADNTIEYVVPLDHYFVMGDNRDNSADSRFLSDFGYVPAENIGYIAESVLRPEPQNIDANVSGLQKPQ